MAALVQQLQEVMWIGFAVAVVLGLLLSVWRSARVKGWWGEYKVKRWLAKGLDSQHYHCMHNITLQLADDSTTQIDHVVVSPYGVFVLETKHMQGWIFGTEKQRMWTQQIYRHRSSFQNPLRQNWRHMKALEEVLQLGVAQLHSVVVFTGDCVLKTAMPANVTQGRAVVNYIRQHREALWSAAEVQQLVQILADKQLKPSRRTHQAHVAQLQARHAKPRGSHGLPSTHHEPVLQDLAPLVPTELSAAPAEALPQCCPECGDPVVQRRLPDGDGVLRDFVRCGRFPHCRFVLAQMDVTVQA